jgi:hypothetical protein
VKLSDLPKFEYVGFAYGGPVAHPCDDISPIGCMSNTQCHADTHLQVSTVGLLIWCPGGPQINKTELLLNIVQRTLSILI